MEVKGFHGPLKDMSVQKMKARASLGESVLPFSASSLKAQNWNIGPSSFIWMSGSGFRFHLVRIIEKQPNSFMLKPTITDYPYLHRSSFPHPANFSTSCKHKT